MHSLAGLPEHSPVPPPLPVRPHRGRAPWFSVRFRLGGNALAERARLSKITQPSRVSPPFARYGHLQYGHDWPLWKAILVSWLIALLEYCLAVPANRLGYGQFTGFQLKIIQEIVTLLVFIVFAVTFLKEKLAWNYLVAFAFLGVAAFSAFAFKAPAPPQLAEE